MADHTTRRRILAAQYAQSPMDPRPNPPLNPTTAAAATTTTTQSKIALMPLLPPGAKLPPHPQPDPQFHQKPLPPPPFLDATKSNSRHERNTTDNQAVVRVVDEIKKPLSSEKPSVESDKVEERFEQGLEVVRRGFVNEQVRSGAARLLLLRRFDELIHAVDCARKARDSLEKFTSKTLALTLKKEFDGVYGAAWHCIVGSSFGSFVTHSVGGFIYFCMDQKLYILLFKTAVQRAA
ncbi:UNVERIFIED_CONTAM: Dynein light chain, cytoplasmic [Sesamum angustifolium]|uniref:Dynein light chain, cytoplasmic n=1 Tax=Sesamum angustifolium TaxID=2727405 RepID=A0AAW2QAR5_9LAMI